MKNMRIEMKIALVLFAINTTARVLVSTPEFISGLLLGLSLFFMVIGLIPEEKYQSLKIKQNQKIDLVKKMIRTNKNAR